MTSKAHYLADILEKIGAPLVSATAHSNNKDEAQNIALLLSRSVQLSIAIGNMIDIDKAGAERVEALRVTLAALASPIIAESYKSTGQVPSETDLNKVTTALESVMTFSDNFMPSDEQAVRMDKLAADGAPVDGYQSNIQYIQALAPVVDAVATFSFGQPEKKMIMDVSNRLIAEAKSVRTASFPQAEGDDTKRVELGLLRGFGEIYALCHKESVARLSALKEPGPDAQVKAADDVWGNFHKRAAMVGVLAQNLSPAGVAAQPEGQQTPASPLANMQPPPANSPAAQASIAAPHTNNTASTNAQPGQEASGASASPAQEPSQGGYNPMSMFGAPGGNAPQGDTTTPQAQPTSPPAQPEQPAAAQSEEVGEDGNGGDSSGDNGNPMAFFKSGG